MMKKQTRLQFEWQKKHVPKACEFLGRALGTRLFTPASFHYDTKYGVDLVRASNNFDASCRVVKSFAAQFWPNFTIRAWLRSKAPTEINKLLEDEYINYGFYGIVSNNENEITHAVIYDGKKFRQFFRDLPLKLAYDPRNIERYSHERNLFSCEYKLNKDQETGFLNFNPDELNTLVPGFIIKNMNQQICDTDWIKHLRLENVNP